MNSSEKEVYNEIDNLKKGWKKVRLDEMIEINPKETLKKYTVAKYVEMANIDCFTRKIKKFELKEYKGGTKFRNGDTLLARITPCLENGKTALVDSLDSEEEVGFGSTEYIVMRARKNLTNSKYIYYMAISSFFRQLAIKSMNGSSGRQRVQNDLLFNQIIDLPPLETQEKIASILSSLDDKIEINNEMNKTLEDIAQTLFKNWFIDFEFPNEEGKPYKSSGGKFVESDLGLIPEGWKVGQLGDVADIQMGQAPKGRSYNEDENGTVFYQGRTDFGIRYPKVRLHTTEPKRIADENDILLSVRAPVGDINIAGETCCIGRGLASLRSNTQCNSFIFYYLIKIQKKFDIYNREGTVFGSINKETLNNIKIIVPKQEIIKIFQKNVERIDYNIKINSKEIQNLTKLKNTLLPKLMSGEIEV